MPLRLLSALIVAVLCDSAFAGPFVNGSFRGRIAYSADGNFNDPDDWAASPMALAIFARAKLKDRVVHFDYNSILPRTDAEWEKTHRESVLGAAERFGYDTKRFFDCRQDQAGAIDSLVQVIDASTSADPLYFIIAGPMEIAVLALKKSKPECREHVYCISHSRWNDGYSTNARHDFFTNNKRDVIALGVNWVQIQEQSRLSTSPYGRDAKDEEWTPFHWARDAARPEIKFLWQRLQVSKRPDCSDAGMAYFLATGDELATPEKLRLLLVDQIVPRPSEGRDTVRIEAEDFRTLTGCGVDYRNDRKASHRMTVKALGDAPASLATRVSQPYLVKTARYDLDLRALHASDKESELWLRLNGKPVAGRWIVNATGDGWSTRTLHDVEVSFGDTLEVIFAGPEARIDFVELRAPISPADQPRFGQAPFRADGPLDLPNAAPGQVIVAGRRPGILKHNGGRPIYLTGSDNPEEFLFMGAGRADGTRDGTIQEAMIRTIAESGVNAFHCQIFRMRRCNFKDEGDDTHCPFLNADPTAPLNEAMLAQWDQWLETLERNGIIVVLEFYNDATDVERMGWTLDAKGELHPEEARMFTGIVNRFKHRKNVMWSIEESCNKLPPARVPHFKKLSELIAKTDELDHPIVQSFVVPNDPEGDYPSDRFASDDYADDPNINVVTWLHVVPHDADYEAQHAEYLKYARVDRGRFVTMKSETYHHPRFGDDSRRYMWSAAMTGLHCIEAYHPVQKTRFDALRDDGRLRQFMEQTPVHSMTSRDDLAAGSTCWVLADPGRSYVAFSYRCSGSMGLRDMPAGNYEFVWFDPRTGSTVREEHQLTAGSTPEWPKPQSFREEVALYVSKKAESKTTSAAEPANEQGWRSLPLIKDGRIDPAWTHLGYGSFSIDNCALRTDCDERGMGLLLYRDEKLGNCQIRVTYRPETSKSNSGVFIRIDDGVLSHLDDLMPPAKRKPDGKLNKENLARIEEASIKELGAWYPVHHGYEVQIMDGGDASHRTGATYSLSEAEPLPTQPADGWRVMIITLDGAQVSVSIDGREVSRFDSKSSAVRPVKHWSEPRRDAARPATGYIGLQNHDPGDVVWFKDVSIRPLPTR